MTQAPEALRKERQAFAVSPSGLLRDERCFRPEGGSSTLPGGSIAQRIRSSVRSAVRVLWLAFRAWNAVLFVLIGASLGIVGCVLLGAAWGAWPWDMSWLGELGKLKSVGSEGAGDVDGHVNQGNESTPGVAIRRGCSRGDEYGYPAGVAVKQGAVTNAPIAPTSQRESGPAPSLPAKAQAGAPEPALDGSSCVGACGKEGSPQPEGASASPAAASENVLRDVVKAIRDNEHGFRDELRDHWRNN